MSPKKGATFRKRYRTVFTKGHELKEICGNDVRIYIIIERHSSQEIFRYNSEEAISGSDPNWPPNVNPSLGVGPGTLVPMDPEAVTARDAARRRRKSVQKIANDSPSDEDAEEQDSPSALLGCFGEDNIAPASNQADVSADSKEPGPSDHLQSMSPVIMGSHNATRQELALPSTGFAPDQMGPDVEGCADLFEDLHSTFAFFDDDLLLGTPSSGVDFFPIIPPTPPAGTTTRTSPAATNRFTQASRINEQGLGVVDFSGSRTSDGKKRTANSPIDSTFCTAMLNTPREPRADSRHGTASSIRQDSAQRKRPRSLLATRLVFPQPIRLPDSP